MKSHFHTLIFFSFSVISHAAILVNDPFDVDGPLPGQNAPVGGMWTGSGTPLQASAGALLLPAVTGSSSNLFTRQTQGTIYAGISFTVTQSPSSGGTFFFSFLNSFKSVARLFIVSNGNSSTYRIGIENDLDNPVYWQTPLSLNTAYHAVVGFSNIGDSDMSSLWINPANQSSTSVQDANEAVATSIDGISFRGASPSSTITRAQLIVDDVRVSDDFSSVIPEPTTICLFGLAASVLAITRRRLPC